MELRGGIVTFAAQEDPDAGDPSVPAKAAKKKRFKMHAYTGAPVEFFGMPMVFDLAGMTATTGTPILQQHMHDKIVALADKAVVDATGLHFEGYCYGTAAAKEVIDLADEGFPWQASMGVKPLEVEFMDEGEAREVNGKTFNGPGLYVGKSRVKESSFVPLGADDATRSLVFADDTAGTVTVRRNVMSASDPAVDPLIAERKRIADITLAFPEDPGYANKHIGLGSSVLEAKAAYNEVLKDQVAKLSSRPGNTTVNTRGTQGSSPQGTPTQRFQARVAELTAAGKTKWDAVRHLAIHEPELHQAYLDEFNVHFVRQVR